MNEAALSRQVEAELALFTYPVQDWVRPMRGPDGAVVHNVVVVGGGQAGLAIAFGLRQERISGVVVLDENSDGLEGPWITYARMITLRTLKFLTGPDLGVPSLTFRRWHAARYAEAAWDSLVRIDKADWMRYLIWFRETLNLPVRNNVRVAVGFASGKPRRGIADPRGRPRHRPGRRRATACAGVRARSFTTRYVGAYRGPD